MENKNRDSDRDKMLEDILSKLGAQEKNSGERAAEELREQPLHRQTGLPRSVGHIRLNRAAR